MILQDRSTVTILQNDNAAGIFFINETTQGPFIIQESTSQILNVIIQREGGAVTSEVIQFEIVPNGFLDFFGGSGFASFSPDQRQFVITILAREDVLPEIDENFSLQISAIGGNDEIIGEPSSVNITILANDDYAGVFSFTSTSLNLFIGEQSCIYTVYGL